MAHPDSLIDLFKPVFALGALAFLIGFLAVFTAVGSDLAGGGSPASTELAAAMNALDPAIRDS